MIFNMMLIKLKFNVFIKIKIPVNSNKKTFQQFRHTVPDTNGSFHRNFNKHMKFQRFAACNYTNEKPEMFVKKYRILILVIFYTQSDLKKFIPFLLQDLFKSKLFSFMMMIIM
jgi:hypothetical protein